MCIITRQQTNKRHCIIKSLCVRFLNVLSHLILRCACGIIISMEKHAGGRPTKFQYDHTMLAAKRLYELGQTDKQICAALEITEATLTNWKHEHEEFFASIKSAKEKADDRVEKSLYKNATGYNYKAQKPMTVSDGNGDGSHIELAEYTEHVPAQTVAQIFWLKNRRPDRWRDRQQIEHSGEIDIPISDKKKELRSLLDDIKDDIKD